MTSVSIDAYVDFVRHMGAISIRINDIPKILRHVQAKVASRLREFRASETDFGRPILVIAAEHPSDDVEVAVLV